MHTNLSQRSFQSMDKYPIATLKSNYDNTRQCEDGQQGDQDVNLIKENKRTLSIFWMFGLWTMKRNGREYKVKEVSFTFSRLAWLLWHLIAVMFSYCIKFKFHDESERNNLHPLIYAAIGIFMFIIVDPVQTNILSRNLRVIPKILKLVRNLEEIKLNMDKDQDMKGIKLRHEFLLGMEGASTVSMYWQRQRDDDTVKKGSCCEEWLTWTITFIIVFILFMVFGVAFSELFDMEYVKYEWKFTLMMFCLPFPVLTTWFCVFFIGYQRKMYKILNNLEDKYYKNKEHVKNMGKYFETMQMISKKLCDDIYRFTFGINFCIFVMIATCAMFEVLEGLNKNTTSEDKNGDIIYVLPIAVSIFHLYISCHRSTNLIQGQHDKLRYKLKGIMVELIMEGQDKQFKMVETLYKNVKDFSPMPQVFGGFRVNYQILTSMLLFIFTYARLFYSLMSKNEK